MQIPLREQSKTYDFSHSKYAHTHQIPEKMMSKQVTEKRNKAINPTKRSQPQMDKPLLEAALISKVRREKGEASILPSSCILPLQHPHHLHPAWLTPL